MQRVFFREHKGSLFSTTFSLRIRFFYLTWTFGLWSGVFSGIFSSLWEKTLIHHWSFCWGFLVSVMMRGDSCPRCRLLREKRTGCGVGKMKMQYHAAMPSKDCRLGSQLSPIPCRNHKSTWTLFNDFAQNHVDVLLMIALMSVNERLHCIYVVLRVAVALPLDTRSPLRHQTVNEGNEFNESSLLGLEEGWQVQGQGPRWIFCFGTLRDFEADCGRICTQHRIRITDMGPNRRF